MFAYVGIALLCVLAAWVVPRLWAFYSPPANLPPGPKTWDFIRGKSSEILGEPPTIPQLRWARKYGDIVSYTMFFGDRKIAISSPELIKEVLVTKAENFKKGGWKKKMIEHTVQGQALLTAPDPHHATQRKAASPPFRFEGLKLFQPAFVKKTQVLLDVWNKVLDDAPKDTAEIELIGYMKKITLDIIGSTGFGYEFNALSDNPDASVPHYNQALDSTTMSAASFLAGLFPVLYKLPIDALQKGRVGIREVQKRVSLMIAEERKKNVEDSTNLLGHLLHNSGKNVTEEELICAVVTFLLAGHETTSVSLCWWFYAISSNPEVLENVREELRSVLDDGVKADDGNLRYPTFEDLKKMEYLEATIKESLRLWAPFSLGYRVAQKDTTLGGYHVPKGTEIQLMIGVMHHLESVYEQPERFWPERWLGDNAKKYSHFDWLPFFAGKRSCIGNRFAVMEMKTVLSMVMPRFSLKLKEGTKVTPMVKVTYQPDADLPMHLTRA